MYEGRHYLLNMRLPVLALKRKLLIFMKINGGHNG